jgi:tetratricopeptide (TPR) repeat protein
MSSGGSGPSAPGLSISERDLHVDGLLKESKAALEGGRLENAAQAAEIATRINPQRGEAWIYLCAALEALSSADLERAIANALRHLGDAHPLSPALNADRARALSVHGRWQEAADLARLTAARPDIGPEQHVTLGSVLSQIALYKEGLQQAEQGAAALPRSPKAHYTLGTSLRYLGRSAEAEAAFNRVLDNNPGDSLALASLSSMAKATPAKNRIEVMRRALENPSSPEAEARLRHALFKELDDLGRREEAWSELVEGARVARSVFDFDMPEKIARTDALIENFPPSAFEHKETNDRPERPRPIFVFGLPRSGTTITERVLAAHSRVTAMGETPSFSRAMKMALGQRKRTHPGVEDIRAARTLDWSIAAELYLGNVAYLLDGADTFTEKTPHNYEFAGLIAKAFPEAALVHVRRAPMDSLFGTYRLMFGEGGYHWSYSFEHLAENYRQYRRVMDHWRACLGDRLIEVTLEELAADSDTQIRQLLQRVGLEFEPACLTPENASGGVSTASATQVRQPINSQGVGRWRTYAEYLEPLRAELERDGFVDRAGDPIWT